MWMNFQREVYGEGFDGDEAKLRNEGESIVPKPREQFSDAILSQNADELAKFMDQPMSAIAESVTGWLAAGPKSWTVMTGHIVQAILKGKMLEQVSREIKELREKGKIPDDYADKKYGGQSWVELLKTIDEETPDQDKLDALKAMFYSVNKIGIEDGERILNYQLFQIAKRLTSGQLMLLKVVDESRKTDEFPKQGDAQLSVKAWGERMAASLGHKLTYLVLKDEPALVEQGLLEPRNVQNTYFVFSRNARITDLGVLFCENIRKYHIEKT
jgi:hypothetical protein